MNTATLAALSDGERIGIDSHNDRSIHEPYRPLFFEPSAEMTLGAEIELQLLDAQGYNLSPAAPEIFKRLGDGHPRITPELFQSTIEVKTGICRSVPEIRRDLGRTLDDLRPVCDSLGVILASAGSHPCARDEDRLLYPSDRYEKMAVRNRWLIKRMVVFGLHVHIGMRDGEHAMAMINAWLPYLPHLLALSASSPFWEGRDTGLASYRTPTFASLPTAGLPAVHGGWSDFQNYYDSARAVGAIDTIKDIWWDIRPHPDFGTIEIRICDALPTLSETMGLIAFIHTLSAWFDRKLRAGWKPEPPPDWVVRENKWRASRWGLDSEIVSCESGRAVSMREDIAVLLEQISDIAPELGCEIELVALNRQLTGYPSYMRQRTWYAETRMLPAVAANLAHEFATDKPILSTVKINS